jgi:V/A-type H+-transporting ATPase subunit I
MALRPQTARWFELAVRREDADDALEALVRQGGVELQWTGPGSPAGELERLAEPLARYGALKRDYGHLWPAPVYSKRCCTLPAEAAAADALRRIERWLAESVRDLAALDALVEERAALTQWRPWLGALSGSSIDLGALSRAGPVLAGLGAVYPAGKAPAEPQGAGIPGSETALGRWGQLADGRIVLGLAPRGERPALLEDARRGGASPLPLPQWLSGNAESAARRLEARLSELAIEADRLETRLRGLALALGVTRATAVLERIQWFRDIAGGIRCEGDLCWISGWTAADESDALDAALGSVGVQGHLELREPPADAPLPTLPRHRRWLRPFEVFTEAVGVPGPLEADPTTWVALLVPLMFGYMCGDVGHGAVILLLALLLRRRTALWPLLAVCGLSAAAFGLVYGDVFGYEHLIEPLWVRPLEDPVALLVVPIVFGALVLTLGVLLHAVETCWGGQGRSEAVADTAQLLVYWGLLLTLLEPALAWLALGGVGLCVGNRLAQGPSPSALAAGLGHLAQSTLELLLNTVSFARLGAFALAHAALESTVVALAGEVEWLVLAVLLAVLGNLLVVALEILAVGIQTTRLVLYEFFIRFFEGRGRRFAPVPIPPGPRTPAPEEPDPGGKGPAA